MVDFSKNILRISRKQKKQHLSFLFTGGSRQKKCSKLPALVATLPFLANTAAFVVPVTCVTSQRAEFQKSKEK